VSIRPEKQSSMLKNILWKTSTKQSKPANYLHGAGLCGDQLDTC